MWRMIKNLAPKVRHPEIRDSRTSADQGGEAEVGCFVEVSGILPRDFVGYVGREITCATRYFVGNESIVLAVLVFVAAREVLVCYM